ncbi:hypothetical protein [Terrarubrum flagellatum]|uniref:hypothetical protein n=1 Tax=Terrirubrum flagellatum TaxID=2895980 RepID=UPI0031454F5C
MANSATGALAAAVLALGAPARAGDLQGLDNEQSLALKGTVVDLVCGLTGKCAPGCGGGKRQLGLRADDGKLYATIKSVTDFAGSTADLLPWCGKSVELDGLLIENPRMRVYLVQSIRAGASEPWKPTIAFQEQWSAKNGKADEWYRVDPAVKTIIDADGVYGIKGLEPKKQ